MMQRIILALVLAFQVMAPQDRIEKAPPTVPATYSASTTFTLPVSSTYNDYITFTGSATKTVYITRIEKTCSLATSAAAVTELLVRRTSETGGTPTTVPAAPHDVNSPAATATITQYGSGLTTGNSGGSVFLERWRTVWPASAKDDTIRDSWGKSEGRGTMFQQSQIIYAAQNTGSGQRPAQPLTLRGTSDIIAVFSGASNTHIAQCWFDVEWYEQ
jgi:hypothetical protein